MILLNKKIFLLILLAPFFFFIQGVKAESNTYYINDFSNDRQIRISSFLNCFKYTDDKGNTYNARESIKLIIDKYNKAGYYFYIDVQPGSGYVSNADLCGVSPQPTFYIDIYFYSEKNASLVSSPSVVPNSLTFKKNDGTKFKRIDGTIYFDNGSSIDEITKSIDEKLDSNSWEELSTLKSFFSDNRAKDKLDFSMIYYTNLNFNLTLSDASLKLITNDKTYTFDDSLTFKDTMYLHYYNTEDIPVSDDLPHAIFDVSNQKTSNVDDIDMITSVDVSISFDINNTSKYEYYYQIGSSGELIKIDSSPPKTTFTMKKNDNIIVKVYSIDKKVWADDQVFELDVIGTLSDYYEDWLNDKFGGDLDTSSDDVQIDWSDGPMALINYWFNLFNEKLPIFHQIPDLLNLFNWGYLYSHYDLSCTNYATSVGNNEICVYLPSIDLSFIGLDTVSIDSSVYEFFRDFREDIFFWVKLFVGFTTFFVCLKNISGVFSKHV